MQSSDGEDDTYLVPSKYIPKNAADDNTRIREYHIRKLKHLIDKCYRKRLRFHYKYVEISQRLAHNTNMVSDIELDELRSECVESLSMAGKPSSTSSSSESDDEHLRNKMRKFKKKSPSRVLPSDTSYSSNSSYNMQYSVPVDQNLHPSRSVHTTARQHPYHMHSQQVSRYSHYDNPPPPPPCVDVYEREQYQYYPHQRSYCQPPLSTYGDTRISPQYEMQYMERSSSPYAGQEYVPPPSQRSVHQHRQVTSVRHIQASGKMSFTVDPARHMQASPKMLFPVNTERHMQATPPARQNQRITKQEMVTEYAQQSTQRGIQTSPEMYLSQHATQRNSSISVEHYSKPFGSSQTLPSFQTIARQRTSTGDQTPVHISTPSSPHSEPLYSDTSLTPEPTSQLNTSTQVINKIFNN